jgi:predicted DNA-binding antitoxin AbrB/MazE fold protein
MAAHILAEGEEAEVVVRAEKIAARLEGLAESVQEFKTCEVRP